MKKLTRRKFLEAGVFSSMVISGVDSARVFYPYAETKLDSPESSTGVFNGHERDLLRLAMDEIIPAADGMPAASEVDSVRYVEQLAGRNTNLAKRLLRSLRALENLSQKRSFLTLAQKQRAEVLARLEREDAKAFDALRDSIYEAYYEQPQVWKLIGYHFYATNGGGPPPSPFDEQILADVRKKPRYYRDV